MSVQNKLLYKKGYLLKVITWENDGDDYRTQEIDGLDTCELNFYIELAQRFKSCNDYKLQAKYGNLGNKENNIYEVFIAIVETLKNNPLKLEQLYNEEDTLPRVFDSSKKKLSNLLKKIRDAEPQINDDTVLELLDGFQYDIYNFIYSVIGYPVGYEYGFCRVYEKHEVYEITEDMVLRVADLREKKE